jgi:WD40 repeat protein
MSASGGNVGAMSGSTFRLWEIDADGGVHGFARQANRDQVAVAQSGMLVAAGNKCGVVTLFDLRVWGINGRPGMVKQWRVGGQVLALEFVSGSDRVAVASAGGKLSLLAGVTSERWLGVDGVTAAGLSSGGRWLVVGTKEGRVVRIEVESGRRVEDFRGHGTAVTAVAFGADGSLVTGSVSGEIREWRWGPLRLVSSLQTGAAGVNCVAKTGGGWIAAGGTDGAVRVWRSARGPW